MHSKEDSIKIVKDQIQSMLRNPIEPKYTPYPMKVSGKVVKQISTGIYRSPGNVLKELVSNSFDADASFAAINTNPPSFKSFSIFDDGQGMSATEFTLRMQRIGASEKLPGEVTPKGRPMIGRIGIGLLAVGHVSQRFRVISARAQDEQGFEAKVDMSRLFGAGAESLPMEELTAGTVQVRMYRKPKDEQYTLVEVENTSNLFRQLLAEKIKKRYKRFERKKPASYKDFVNYIQRKASRVSQLSGYDQALWELGLLAPVPYLEEGPVQIDSEVISSLKKRLLSYQFSLYVDDIEIRKPIMFPPSTEEFEKGSDYGVYPIRIKEETDEGPIEATGYLYHQNVRVVPAEQRGLLPRMRNVGIGLPYLNIFRILIESPIITFQVSGELYVDKGLDDALNIDRNSFFEASPSFQKLKEALEKMFREEKIATDIKRRQSESRTKKQEHASSSEIKGLERVAERAGVREPRVNLVAQVRPIPLSVEPSGVINVYMSKLPKSQRFMLEGVILCFELSRKSKDAEAAFYRLLQGFLDDLLKKRE